MKKRKLPALQAEAPRAGVEFDLAPSALQRWNAGLRADATDAPGVIGIYGPIGETWDGDGMTPQRIAGALRAIGDKDVIVNINSPGGDVFAGIAIYNLLREHKGAVTVRVVGMAASAASVIAMAGDHIEIGRAAFVMIHNVWLLAVGNRNDLRAMADTIEPIDRALASLYAARSGGDAEEIAALMDKETWLGGEAAIEQGFADALLPADQVQESADGKRPAAHARTAIQAALAKAGYSRAQQRELIKEFSGTPGAAANAMPGAGDIEATHQSTHQATQPHSEDLMNLEELKAKHPDLYSAAQAEGATAERARIQAVEAQAMAGHDALINALKFDGKTTGPEAAVQVLAAEKHKLQGRGARLANDAQAVSGVPSGASATGEIPSAQDPANDVNLSVEDRAKAAWDKDANLRAEFGNAFASYLAFARADAEGRVKQLRPRTAA